MLRRERYNPAGELTAVVLLPFPAAIHTGPDRMLYVNHGDSPTGPDSRLGPCPDGMLYAASASGRLVRIDPTAGSTCDVHNGEPLASVTAASGGLILGTELGSILHLSTDWRSS
ncbi:hypothetical protein H0264_23505 [Nocardia huaxiensis]|uniref:SMP-30/gluconolaconase/LRE-like protein n=1 Tax=Nocardia huaxiensis TaxID=2755382 RepID=A0A7D6ZDH3_9NOCA|nr:hypothetical protein [Nocardia huaxiensis]QLY28339.1 hypothetical protein H0264_23505 [Nocardia huaxiensis]